MPKLTERETLDFLAEPGHPARFATVTAAGASAATGDKLKVK